MSPTTHYYGDGCDPPHVDPEMTQLIWDAWNALPKEEERPIRTIAAALAITTAEVAAVVYPDPRFGVWDESQEP